MFSLSINNVLFLTQYFFEVINNVLFLMFRYDIKDKDTFFDNATRSRIVSMSKERTPYV